MVAAGLFLAAPKAAAEDAVASGPFGISLGESVAALGSVTQVDANTYAVPNPPRPNANFDLVMVKVYPGLGVCTIIGMQRFPIDPAGAKVRPALDRVAALLRDKYGPELKKLDTCEVRAQSCGLVWSSIIFANQADYMYLWSFTGAQRADHIGTISLVAGADDETNTQAVLGYASSDPKCVAATKATSSGAP